MMLLHAGRGTGKTTQAMAWVSHGKSVPYSYPGWTRVLVVCDFAEFERLKKEYWARLEDFDHRVYPIKEWLDANNVNPSTEVCVDNFDRVIHAGWRNFPGWITAVTITAEPWVNQTFHTSVHERT